MVTKRDIGKMGESHFENLCNQVDITANRSNPDRYGWDFLLEFPKHNSCNLPLDMQDIPIECKVQVKASDRNNGKCQIKLSAMERLVKSSSPTFIYFVNFNASYEPFESFLVHIDKGIIEQVLKRIRKNEVAQEIKELHKIKITIKYNESHQLNNESGVELKKQIETYISKGMKEYEKEKSEFLEKVGFSEHAMKINMTITGKDTLTDLVDVSLGLKNIDVPISINETTMTRFGMELPFTIFPNGMKNMKVKIKANREDAILNFKDKNGRILLRLNLDIYQSPINILNNPKIVLSNTISSFILSEEKFIHKANIKHYEDEFEFKEFYDYLKFFYIVNKYSNNTLSMSIESQNLNIDKLNFGEATFNSQEFLEYFEIIKKLKKVFNFLEIDLNFKISATILYEIDPFIDILFTLLFENKNHIDIFFQPNTIEGIAVDEIPEKGNIIIPVLLQISQKIFAIYIVFDSAIHVNQGKGKITAVKINRCEIFESSVSKFDNKWIEANHNIIVDSLETNDTYAIINNYIEIFEVKEKLLEI